MSVLDGTLAELARMRSGDEPIVSLYLDIRWGDEQQRERVRLFVQDRVRKKLAALIGLLRMLFRSAPAGAEE